MVAEAGLIDRLLYYLETTIVQGIIFSLACFDGAD